MAPHSLALVPLALAAYGVLAAEEVVRRPPCRKSPEFHSLTWPDGTDRVVAFGGKGYSWKHTVNGSKAKVQMFGDTWGFDPTSNEWEELGGANGHVQSPSSRWKPSSCTVDSDRTLVLFGGDHITNISGVMQDLWVFRTENKLGGGHWRQVHTHNTPRSRRGHILEASSTHLLVMGGKTYVPHTDGVVLTDLWTIPLAALKEGHKQLSWTRGADFPGSPRWGATGTMMKATNGDDVMAVFGGRHLNAGAGFHSTDASAYTYYNEVWLYSFKNNSWTKPDIKGPAPGQRDHHGATELNGDLWVFGGRRSEERALDAVLNDLWSFSLSTMSWTLHQPAVNGAVPIGRYMPGVAGTTWKGKPAIAVFGGETLPGSTKETSMNDVWYYLPSDETPGAGEWTEVLTSDCSEASVAPSALAEVKEEQQASGPIAPAIVMVAVAFAVGGTLAFRAEGQKRRAAGGSGDSDCEQPYVAVE